MSEPLNCSTYDNFNNGDEFSPELSEGISLVISDVLCAIHTSEPVIFCPFCVSSFANVTILEKHLKSFHSVFVSELLNGCVSLLKCPFCPAKCCSMTLSAKHSLVYHAHLIFSTFFVANKSNVTCQFCPSSISINSIADHVQEFHTFEYNEWFARKFNLLNCGVVGLTVKLESTRRIDEDIDIQLQKLHIASKPSRKSILKDEKVMRKRKLPVRRELRFSVSDKENVEHSTLNGRRNSAGKINRDWATVLQNCSFRCGKCSALFASNKKLVEHVKCNHKSLTKNLFHPIYQCALCGVKFFKDSYLKKHNVCHQLNCQM